MSLILFNCKGSYKVDDLYIQRIANSSKVIYKYNGWVGNSQFWGTTIIDSTEKLSVPSPDELPITIFKKIPNKDTVDIIYLKWLENKATESDGKVKQYTIDANEIKCKINEYEKINGSSKSDCFLVSYSFEGFKETDDSLYVFGINKVWKDIPELPDEISFPKGNITIFENYKVKNEVVRLVIEELQIYNSKGCLKTYYFEPKKKIYTTDFSDYGFFKKYQNQN